jgi:hypothetical protein
LRGEAGREPAGTKGVKAFGLGYGVPDAKALISMKIDIRSRLLAISNRGGPAGWIILRPLASQTNLYSSE